MNTNDPHRNEPNEKGRKNDPNVRDESAAQPGVSTVSNSDYDDDNEKLTETAKDDFRTIDDHDPTADKRYDEGNSNA